MDLEKFKQEVLEAKVGDVFEIETEGERRGATVKRDLELVVSNTGEDIALNYVKDVEEVGASASQLPLPTWGEEFEGISDGRLFPVFTMIGLSRNVIDQVILFSHEDKYSFSHGEIVDFEKKGNMFD